MIITTSLATTPALIGHTNGHVTTIEVDNTNRLDTCDCHRLVWPAQALTYNWAADAWDCPLYLAG